jgi:hypothetical protein
MRYSRRWLQNKQRSTGGSQWSASRRLGFLLNSGARLTESTKSEQRGQTHTKEINVVYEKVSGKYYKDNPLTKKQANDNQMYVNGKYIRVSHPLHKPGRYKTFEDAAFSSLSKYELSREGQVYIITNPNFPEWVKVGMAVDSEDRLNGYQTSSPFRDYELFTCWSVADRRSAESEAHSLLDKMYERRGEWFNCTPEQAQSAIAELMEQHK